MNGEIKYEMKVYLHSEGMSLQFTNQKMQTIASAYLEPTNPNKGRLLAVFKEAVCLEIETLFEQLTKIK